MILLWQAKEATNEFQKVKEHRTCFYFNNAGFQHPEVEKYVVSKGF